MNKVNGGDGIPAEIFKIPKDDPIIVLQSVCLQIGKPQQWPQDWKRSVVFPIPRKAVPKNIQTTGQLCSFCMLVRVCS